MAQSAWTATVWGGAQKAMLASTARKLQPGEDECMICRDDVPASVKFISCGHTACFFCVEQLRAKNVFKADKGVKCPFCRAYIESYTPANRCALARES